MAKKQVQVHTFEIGLTWNFVFFIHLKCMKRNMFQIYQHIEKNPKKKHIQNEEKGEGDR